MNHLSIASILLVQALILNACASNEVSLNRRYLLDPTMDPKSTERIGNSLSRSAVDRHDVSSQGSQSTLGGSCPTCGSK
jgi:hypothetical protein